MFAILHALGMFVADLFKSRSRLEAENLLPTPARAESRSGMHAMALYSSERGVVVAVPAVTDLLHSYVR
jgi:hypothetical protein